MEVKQERRVPFTGYSMVPPNIMSLKELQGRLPSWSRCDYVGPVVPTLELEINDDLEISSYEELAAGWPMISLRCWFVRRWMGQPMGSRPMERVFRGRGYVEIPIKRRFGEDYSVLPLIPIWPGFVVNSLFYSVMLAVLVYVMCVPFLLRRQWRVRQGCCVHCGYPIGVSSVCTECGEVLDQERIGLR